VTAYFADTFFFLALLNPDDQAHMEAVRWASEPRGPLVTTAWVLAEVADAMAAPGNRRSFLMLVSALRHNSAVDILPPEPGLFERGLDLYSLRRDRSWSLTDCISFVVMVDRGLSEALTGDEYFEEAGFKAVLRPA
jgi:uncharacterized protein